MVGRSPEPAWKPQRSGGHTPSTERVSTGRAIDAVEAHRLAEGQTDGGRQAPIAAAPRVPRPGGSAPFPGRGRAGGWGVCTAPLLLSALRERAVEVPQDVVDVLQPYRDAHHVG